MGGPTSTFTYTVVFAAGLAFDARAKAVRNRQWEEAFAHLRDGPDGPSSEQSAHKSEVHTDQHSTQPGLPWNDAPDDLNWYAAQQAVGMDVSQDVVPQKERAQSSWEDLTFDSRLPGAQRPEWPANTGRDIMPYNLPPQSLWAPDAMRLAAVRRRDTWKKLALKRLSTGLLVHTLMYRANLLEHFSTAAFIDEKLSPQLLQIASLSKHKALRARDEILQDIERLQKIDVNSPATVIARAKVPVQQPAIPHYFQDADGDFHGICEQMNAAIKQLFQSHRGNDKMEALGIAKICHNLLVSTAPPDVQTFNLLLSGFKLWQRSALVDDIMGAFYTQKVRPNEITCREILYHYTHQSRPEDFSRFVEKMRGTDGALMLANPNIAVNEASQGRLLRVNEVKVYQKVHPTPMVLGALMNGVLKFAGFDRALDIYYEMKADGWGLDLSGLTRLLKDCIRRADWEGGIYLWKEINSIQGHVKEQHMAKAYYHMLSLCSVAGNTPAFNQILNEVAQRGFDTRKIINSAMKLTEQTRASKDYVAPAWTADNILIAVSSYIQDERSSKDEVTEEVDITDIDAPSQNNRASANASKGRMARQKDSINQERADTKDAWARWVEHELGKRP